MPNSYLKHLAKKTGKSITQIENVWEKAKSAVKKEYPNKKQDQSFWAIVTKVTQKMLGINEDGTAMSDPVPPTITTTTANIAPGMSGEFRPKVGKIFKRYKE